MLISRKIEEQIRKLRSFYHVITITGPRQSGKTTLCRNLFSGLPYVNFEDILTRMEVVADPKRFIKSYPNGIIIDEAHNFPEIFSYIQVEVDEDIFRQKNDRLFVVTGSSNFLLLEKVTQSMAGRTAILTLLPLSLKEINAYTGPIQTDTLILNGGYPAVWANHIPREIMFGDYYTTYVERDARQVVNLKEIGSFHRFIRLCAGRTGTEFNGSALANETGVNTKTVSNWINILGASYIVYLLPPYFENLGKRLTKTPKIYFYDTGLAAYLLGITSEAQLDSHPVRGQLFENMVLNEMLKERFNNGKDNNFFFYRDQAQHEVDVVQWNGSNLSAFEIKSAMSFNTEYFKNLKYLKKLMNERLSRTAVIYDGEIERDSPENGIYNFRNFKL